jgi:hypothetical protein
MERPAVVVVPDFVGGDPVPGAPGALREEIVDGGGDGAVTPVREVQGKRAAVGLSIEAALGVGREAQTVGDRIRIHA